jgi:hypothetical protein
VRAAHEPHIRRRRDDASDDETRKARRQGGGPSIVIDLDHESDRHVLCTGLTQNSKLIKNQVAGSR